MTCVRRFNFIHVKFICFEIEKITVFRNTLFRTIYSLVFLDLSYTYEDDICYF